MVFALPFESLEEFPLGLKGALKPSAQAAAGALISTINQVNKRKVSRSSVFRNYPLANNFYYKKMACQAHYYYQFLDISQFPSVKLPPRA